MASPPFLAIRIEGLGVVLAHHTQAVPGSQADAGILMASVDAKGMQYTVLAWLRGFTAAQVEAIRRDAETVYGRKAEVLRQSGDEAVLRYGWAMKDLRSPILQTLSRIQHSFGLPWTHVEAGQLTLYASIRSVDRGKAAVEALRRHLGNVGLEAGLEVVELGPKETAAFERLKALLADETLRPA